MNSLNASETRIPPSAFNGVAFKGERISIHRRDVYRRMLAGDLVTAVETLSEVFVERGVEYALLGGLATMLRGRPRFTQDVDILLSVPQVALPGLLDELIRRGFSLDADTVIREFVQHHMTAFRFGVVRIDWLKPVLPLEERIRRGRMPR